MDSLVVVGASLAGLHAVRAARQGGFEGEITVVGADPEPPYDRPPLSKQFLSGAWNADRTALARPADDDLDIDWRLGQRATGLDLEGRNLILADDSTLTFDGLVLACGASPIRLPDTKGVGGVHVLRTLADATALRDDLDAGPDRVVVVGAGFIGAEVAATCHERDLEVTMVDVAEAPMIRGLGPEMGAYAADLHRSHGVDLRLGVGVDALEGDPVRRVVLSDGSSLDASVVVLGIGVRPETGWLEGSGLDLDDGIVCDATCLAAPGVTAAGDVARWYSERAGRHVRVEHWENAIAHGEAAARRLLVVDDEAPPVYDPTPWFWSDQYDRKFQLTGTTDSYEEVEIVHGALDEGRFVAVYHADGRTLGVLGVNRPRHVMLLRGHADDRSPVDQVRAAARDL